MCFVYYRSCGTEWKYLSRLLVPSMTLEPFSAPFSRYDLHEWQIGTGTRSLAHVYVQTQAIIP